MKATSFYGKIKDGIWRFTAEKVFAAHCGLQKDGDYTMELTRTVASKTNSQLGYFHAVVVPVIFKQMKEDEGEDLEGKKRIPMMSFMVKGRLKEIPMVEDNVILMLKIIWAKQYNCEVKSKADMNIEEASQLIDSSVRWAKRYLQCDIPSAAEALY